MTRLPLVLSLLLLLPSIGCELFEDLLDGEGDPGFAIDSSGTVYGLVGEETTLQRPWSQEVGTASLDSAAGVASGGRVIVGYGAQVTAVDADGGTTDWSRSVEDSVVAITADGTSAFALSFTVLTALRLDGGEVDWVLDFAADDIQGVAHEAVAAGGGVLALGGDPVRLLDPASGDLIGSWASGDDQMRAIGISEGQVFVGHRGGLTALRATDGTERWTVATGGEVDNLVVDGDSVFYSIAGGGVGWATADGSVTWTVDDGGLYDALAVGNGVAVGARNEGTLLGWDPTGEEQWALENLRTPLRGLAPSGETLFVASGNVIEGINIPDGGGRWGEWAPEGTPLVVGAR